MDYVSLCVMIAKERDKLTWKSRLCGTRQHVQGGLVRADLDQIQHADLKHHALEIWDEHFVTVESHLQRQL